ncbi:dual oxidase maturation factor 1 [Patagioenas fasciata monilis]|uniref:Dual oxidase maturation factor 1 n=1 Tax=Patagioenas fasciata monilis TaxID=372326 RepID=A0A1V4KQ51_PATFA|nr:dual oxidase maturation factor 1 [Patagioenas fasciata monilis]
MTLWNGSFPFYPGTNACFPIDTAWAVIVSIFLSVLATSIIILPGIRGRARLFWFLRVLTGLFVGAVVLSVQFSRDWETGWVVANTSYKSFSRALVKVDIGLHIGLAGVNVTLVGNPVNQVNETINYNEHFAWSFGADYDHSYGEGLEKGLPNPILYVAEKFTTPSPCNLHGQYRISGHYASLTLCPDLHLDGAGTHGEEVLMCLHMLCIAGLLCLVLGLGVLILNSLRPEKLKLVFNMDEGKREEEEVWDKSCRPAEPSSSARDVLMVPLGELCEVTATWL